MTAKKVPEIKIIKGVPLVEIEKLIPYIRNARHHSQDQVARIANSIRAFGFLVPVLVDQHNNIIAGHGRIMAAQALGMKQVPVVQADHLTDSERRAYTLADNRLAELSVWDDAMKTMELAELEMEGVNLELLGFGEKMPSVTDDEDELPGNMTEEFALHVTFANETDQKKIYEDLSNRGFTCKLLS